MSNTDRGETLSDYDKILAELYEILKPFVPDGVQIKEETDLVNDLNLDSLRVMKLVVAVEDSFDISIPINILPQIRTVEDFVLQLEQLTGEGP
jgi:acyl carrier protein